MTEAPVTEADLHALVDGRLAPERAALVAAWLRAHPDAAARVAAYRTQAEELRLAFAPVADEPVPPRLDLRLRVDRARRDRTAGSGLVAAGVAALMLVGAAGGWTLRGWTAPPRAGTAALAREAASSYAVYVGDRARPVEIAATQQAALDRWFSQRLARPVKAPDLRAAGLRLVGGRLVATEHGPAGLYLYQDGAQRWIGVYVRPMEVEGTDRLKPREESGVTGWTWADEGLGFGIFGNGPSEHLRDAAGIVRAQYRRS